MALLFRGDDPPIPPKSRSALVNSATIPASSSPAASAVRSQISRVLRNAVSSGSPTVPGVPRTNVPCPGRPAASPRCSSSR